jgi:hypothetical protein
MNNTYWAGNRVAGGRNMSDMYNLVNGLIPFTGECDKSAPKLERLRKACNVYYNALNNGCYAGFSQTFKVSGKVYTMGYQHSAMGRALTHELEALNTVETKLDALVMAAAEEAGFLR